MSAPLQLIETTPRRRRRLTDSLQALVFCTVGGLVGVLFWL